MKRSLLIAVGSMLALAGGLTLNILLWVPPQERSLEKIRTLTPTDSLPFIAIGVALCGVIVLALFAIGLDIKLARMLEKIFRE